MRPPRLPWSAVALAALVALTSAHSALAFTKCADLKCTSCDQKKNRCTLCVEGMFLASNGVCTKCKATGCKTCSASGTKCTKCMQENMYIHMSGSCRECNIYGCATCNSTGQCTKCWGSSMYLAPNGTCQSCGEYCAECRPDGSCAECWDNDSQEFGEENEPTFLIVRAPNGTCAQCTKHPWRTGCRACSPDGRKCTKCGEGSVMINSTCHPCKDENCAVCSPSPDKCQKCMKRPAWAEYAESDYGPVYMDREGNCRECTHMVGYGCKACDQDGKCKHCDPDTGRVLRNGACVPCDGLVEHCYECTAKGKCTACEDGFHLRGGKCVPCDRVDPFCEYWESTPVCSKRCASCISWPLVPLVSWGPTQPPPTSTGMAAAGSVYPTASSAAEMAAAAHVLPASGWWAPSVLSAATTAPVCRARKAASRLEAAASAPPMASAAWPVGTSTKASKTVLQVPSAALRLMLDPHQVRCLRLIHLLWKWGGRHRCVQGRQDGPVPAVPARLQRVQRPPLLMGERGLVLVGGQPKRCADPLCVECDAATQKKCSSCREFSPTPPYVGVYMDARGKCHECTVKGCELCGIDGRCRRCEYGYSKVKPEGKCMVV